MAKTLEHTIIHVGTSGYSYKEWKGTFYPARISPGEMLGFYAARLDSVEINNTFYHMPTKAVLSSWAGKVPDNFVFALKAPQVITHFKRLRDVDEEMDYLFRTLAVLGGRLGPVLFQFPKSFRADMPALEAFLGLVPEKAVCAFEFRSPTWLDAGAADLLQKRDHGLCTADTEETPAGEIIPTASWGYLRLRRPDYTEDELQGWLARVRAQKWQRAFVYFKHEDGARGAELAMRFRELAGPAAT